MCCVRVLVCVVPVSSFMVFCVFQYEFASRVVNQEGETHTTRARTSKHTKTHKKTRKHTQTLKTPQRTHENKTPHTHAHIFAESWECRVPMSSDKAFYLPVVIPLWGIVEVRFRVRCFVVVGCVVCVCLLSIVAVFGVLSVAMLCVMLAISITFWPRIVACLVHVCFRVCVSVFLVLLSCFAGCCDLCLLSENVARPIMVCPKLLCVCFTFRSHSLRCVTELGFFVSCECSCGVAWAVSMLCVCVS